MKKLRLIAVTLLIALLAGCSLAPPDLSVTYASIFFDDLESYHEAARERLGETYSLPYYKPVRLPEGAELEKIQVMPGTRFDLDYRIPVNEKKSVFAELEVSRLLWDAEEYRKNTADSELWTRPQYEYNGLTAYYSYHEANPDYQDDVPTHQFFFLLDGYWMTVSIPETILADGKPYTQSIEEALTYLELERVEVE